MNVLLVTSHPIAPPWNSADRNLARALLLGDDSVTYTFLGDRRDPTPWPARHDRARLAVRSDIPTSADKLRCFAWLLRHSPDVDLVHVLVSFRPESLAPRALLLARWMRRRPWLMTCPTAASLPSALLPRANTVVTLSARTLGQVRASGVVDSCHIDPGVDLERLRPAPAAEQRRMLDLEDRPHVLFAGHHDPGGGLEAAMGLFARLHRLHPEARLLLALRRRPDDRPAAIARRLAARAHALGIHGAIRELGSMANMRAAVGASEAVLFQPAELGLKMELPLTLLEALACGRPVVVSPIPPLPELADGTPAVVVGEATSAATLQHLARLLEDPPYAQRARRAARQLAERRFDATAMVSAYRRVYRHVLDGSPGGNGARVREGTGVGAAPAD